MIKDIAKEVIVHKIIVPCTKKQNYAKRNKTMPLPLAISPFLC